MECVRPCRSACCHPDETPSFSVQLQTAHDYPTPFPATANFPAAECTRLLCRVALPHRATLPAGCTRLAAVRLFATCADMFPLVSDYSHICFLLDLLQLLLLLPLLLSRSSHGHTVRLKIHLPLRAARVPTSILPSRGFSRCCFPSFRRDTTLPAPSYAFFAIGKFRRWWYSSPPCSTFGGWRLFPTGLPLCPALECWYSFQPAPREQGPAPISSPMKLHRSLLFASSRVFVSPVQPALLLGSPRIDGFHVLNIGVPQGRDKEE